MSTLRDLIVKIDFKGIDTRKLTRLDQVMDGMESKLDRMGAEMNDFENETRQATRQTDKLGEEMRDSARAADRLGASLQWAGRMGSGGIGLMTAAVGGLVTGLAGAATALGAVVAGFATFGAHTGIKYNADMETALMSWETILGNAREAKDTMTGIQKMAAQTPFETQGLDKTARLLTLAGYRGDKLFEAMRDVGDAVSAVGGNDDTLEGVAMALYQMSAKGKVQAEEMQQLAERAIPAWDLLAKRMGKTTAQLMEMSANGELMAKDVLPLLIEGMGDRFGGSMEKHAKTFNGMMSTLKDNFKILMGVVTRPLFDRIVVKMPKLLSFMDVLIQQTKYFGAHGFFSAFFGKDGADTIMSAFEDVKMSAKSAWDYLDRHFISNPKFRNLPDLESKVEFVIGDLWQSFKNWLNTGGKTQLTQVAGDVTGFLIDEFRKKIPAFVDVALTIGYEMGGAIIRGIHMKLNSMLPDWAPGKELSNITTYAPELWKAGSSVFDAIKAAANEKDPLQGGLAGNNGDFSGAKGFMDWMGNGGLAGNNGGNNFNKFWSALTTPSSNTTKNTTITPTVNVTVQPGAHTADRKVMAQEVAKEVNVNMVRLWSQLQAQLNN